MQRFKIVVFTLLPAAILFAVIEVSAQVYWRYLRAEAMGVFAANREQLMKNNAINFMNQPDSVLVYRLKANLRGKSVTNSRGLAQAEEVEFQRVPQSLRVLGIGESTTHGHSATANYPSQLRALVRSLANGYSGGTEVINGGVSGWISDQWTLYSERELHRYRPDVVILYAGWNDFQSYDPFIAAPRVSYFSDKFGSPPVTGLKSVVLLRAFLDKTLTVWERESVPVRLTGTWKPESGASLGEPTGLRPLRAVLPPSGQISLVLPAQVLTSRTTEYILDVDARGRGTISVTAHMDRDGRDSIYGSCTTGLAIAGSSLNCRFVKPEGRSALRIGIAAAKTGEGAEIEIQDVRLSRARTLRNPKLVAEWGSLQVRDQPEATYRFFLENLTRTVDAFRQANPEVKIAISSLVARWPMDTDEQFQQGDGHIWWMESHAVTRKEAPALLARFNSLIEQYAADNGLLFVDMARVFQDLDRQRLMWDFAHMTEDGYRIIAHVFYRQLRRAGHISGRDNPQMETLLDKYQVKAPEGS